MAPAVEVLAEEGGEEGGIGGQFGVQVLAEEGERSFSRQTSLPAYLEGVGKGACDFWVSLFPPRSIALGNKDNSRSADVDGVWIKVFQDVPQVAFVDIRESFPQVSDL